MKLHYFGELNPDDLEDYYVVDVELNGQQIEIDLNFTDTSIAESQLLKVNSILEKLPEFADKLRGFINNDFKNGEDVQEYLDHHIDELGDELTPLLAKADQSLPEDEQLLSVLYLKRIGFYPEDEETFTVSDFGLNDEISQYILAVNTTEDQDLHYITMES